MVHQELKSLAEKSPEGWEGTVKALKKHGDEVDNPWALAHWMKKKGYKSHKESINEAKFAVKFNIGTMGETAMIVIDAASEGAAKMLVAKQLRQGQKGIVSVKRVEAGKAKQVSQRLENVNEGRYHDYRNDESLSPKQKIGYSMREVRDKLNELDKLVKMNVRLKNEIGVDSTSYWKRTHTAMKKISERLVKLANKVGQLY